MAMIEVSIGQIKVVMAGGSKPSKKSLKKARRKLVAASKAKSLSEMKILMGMAKVAIQKARLK